MRRIGFRRLLPVVNTIVYLALIYAGFSNDIRGMFQRRVGFQEPRQAVLMNAARQEVGTGEWDPQWDCYWVPSAHQVAYAVSLPANILGTLVGGSMWRWLGLRKVHFGQFWSESAFIAGWTLLFVPVIWFYAGQWLDRQLGLLPPCNFRQGRAAKILRVVYAVTSILLLVFYLGLLVYAIFVVRGYSGVDIVRMFFWSFWFLFAALVTTSNLRQARRQAPAKSA